MLVTYRLDLDVSHYSPFISWLVQSLISLAFICIVILPYICFLVLVRVLLLTLTDLTCSHRSNMFVREFGHGSMWRQWYASWMTTDLVHLLRIDTVGTESSLCLLARSNLTAPFRVVPHGCECSRDILWDRPCRAAIHDASPLSSVGLRVTKLQEKLCVHCIHYVLLIYGLRGSLA